MRSTSFVAALLAGALAVSVGLAGAPTLAQEATPEAAVAMRLPLTPDPATCMAEALPIEEMQAIYDEVHAGGTDAAATAEEFVEPEGEAADAATAAAVTEVVVEVIRCNANGGNGLADAYYLTDQHLRENLAEMTPEDFAAYTAQTPLPAEDWLMVYKVDNVRMLPDGRVAANPEIVVPGVGHFRDTLIFAQVDGRWLIDESHEGEPLYLTP